MRRRPFVRLLAVLALVGCANSSDVLNGTLPITGAPLPVTNVDVIGTFALLSADGVPLPFTVFTTATAEWRLKADAIVLAPDGTWSETSTYLVLPLVNGVPTAPVVSLGDTVPTRQSVVSGTYRVANGQINFVLTDGGARSTFVGSVSGNALILAFENKRYAYTR
jgi:hypothetical protein